MFLHDRLVEIIERFLLLANFAVELIYLAVHLVHPVVVHILARVVVRVV